MGASDPTEPGGFRSIPAADADFLPVAVADGAQIALYRLNASTDGPVLLCGHATGMAAGSYLPLLRMLADRARVYAYDMRGHGGSHFGANVDAQTAADSMSVAALADDLRAVADAVRADARSDELYYAAHSISGVAALHLGAAGGHAPWRDLILFEPPVMIGADHPLHEFSVEDTLKRADGTKRRRAEWDSPEALGDVLRRRGVFARFRPDMLEAHVHATLRPLADGGYRLACDPLLESAFFRSVPASGMWDLLPRFPLPARFVGGDASLPDPGAEQARWVTVAAPDIAARVPGATFRSVDGTDHMMVCERPDACRDLIFDMLDGRPWS
ncbi:MAG: alpha/beta hydrolase [Pseudomonadota bacterium]